MVGTATSDPSPGETIVQEICNHVKNEEELRRVGNTYDFIYPKAHPPKVGAIPPVEILGTSLL